MSDNKKYYYLKLKEHFFESDEMIILESMQDGYIYCNILLKLYLRSLKNGGKLMFNDRIPFNSTMLAQVTRHSVGDIEKAMNIFKELSLVEVMDTGAIFITDIQNFIGESSTEVDRIRAYRTRINAEKHLELPLNSEGVQMNDKSTPEIEIEKEIKLDKEIYINIVAYLNEKANTKFRPDIKKTKDLIKARMNEGFIEQDFYQVIDNKVKDWLHKKDFKQYLRPQTLFGTNFESYLNQNTEKKSEVINLPFGED